MLEELRRHNAIVQERIMKSFGYADTEDFIQKGEDEYDLYKAHQDGDIHPKHPDWVWVSSASGGKGDWRKLNGRSHKKHSDTQASNKFLENFKNASDDVLNKIVSGKIQAVDRERKLAQQILDSRKKSTQEAADEAKEQSKGALKQQGRDNAVAKFARDNSDELKKLQAEAVKIGYSSMSSHIYLNGEKKSIYIKIYKHDNYFEHKPNTYSISVGKGLLDGLEKISEDRSITVDKINDAVKTWINKTFKD